MSSQYINLPVCTGGGGGSGSVTFLNANVPAAGTTIVINFTDTGTPPLIPTSGATGFSATDNSNPLTITAVNVTAPDQITLSLAQTVLEGDTVTVSYSPGNVTNSSYAALQPFSDYPVTNNSTETYVPAAVAYFANITANGGTISDASKGYANTFIKGMMSAGLWDLMYEIGPCMGDQLAAAQCKMLWNAAASDPSVATNVNFTSGDYTETGSSGGFTSNVTNTYLSTGYIPGSMGATTSSYSFGYYALQLGSGGFSPLPMQDPEGIEAILPNAGSFYEFYNADVGVNGSAYPSCTGFWVNSRTSTTDMSVYQNASFIIGSSSSAVYQSSESQNVAGFPGNLGDVQFMFWFFSQGLTSGQVTTLTGLVNALQTSLGRNQF